MSITIDMEALTATGAQIKVLGEEAYPEAPGSFILGIGVGMLVVAGRSNDEIRAQLDATITQIRGLYATLTQTSDGTEQN